MNRGEVLHSLELDDDEPVYQQVYARFTHSLSLVAHADRHLSCKRYPAVREFDAQSLLIRGFEKSRPKHPVHLESGPDDAMNQTKELSVWLPYLLGGLGALAVHFFRLAQAPSTVVSTSGLLPYRPAGGVIWNRQGRQESQYRASIRGFQKCKPKKIETHAAALQIGEQESSVKALLHES